jgi:hypothetical protein
MAIKKSVSPQEVVDFFNELLEIDREAISEIILGRVQCLPALAEHPTVQVGDHNIANRYEQEAEHFYDVGALGILNGLFGIHDEGKHRGWGTIAGLVIIETGIISKFYLIYPDSDSLGGLDSCRFDNY